MQAGKLRRKIVIQENQYPLDELGKAQRDVYGAPIDNWVDVWTCRASVEPLSGREYFAAAQVQAQQVTRFRIRYARFQIWPGMRVKYHDLVLKADRYFDINAVIDQNEMHVEVFIMATEQIKPIALGAGGSSSASESGGSSPSDGSDGESDGPSNPFLPTDVAGCKLWLRSDLKVTKDGSNLVSLWADQSGNGYDATPSSISPVCQPNILNGHPAIYLADADHDLECYGYGPALSGPFTWFVVFNGAMGSPGGCPFGATSDSTSAMFTTRINHTSHSLMIQIVDDEGNEVDPADPSTDYVNQDVILSYVRSATAFSAYRNGVLRINNADLSSLGVCTFDQVAIGVDPGYSFLLIGRIFEIIAYDSALGTTDRQAVEAYLVERYAL